MIEELKTILNDSKISYEGTEEYLSVPYTFIVNEVDLPGIIVVHPTKKKTALHVYADGEDSVCTTAIQAWTQICLILKKKNATNNGKLYRNVPTPEECVEDDPMACIVCHTKLGKRYGYGGTGMCGPCCTGEADTCTEFGETW